MLCSSWLQFSERDPTLTTMAVRQCLQPSSGKPLLIISNSDADGVRLLEVLKMRVLSPKQDLFSTRHPKAERRLKQGTEKRP